MLQYTTTMHCYIYNYIYIYTMYCTCSNRVSYWLSNQIYTACTLVMHVVTKTLTTLP